MEREDPVTSLTNLITSLASRMEEMDVRTQANLIQFRDYVEAQLANRMPASAPGSPMPDLSESPVAAATPLGSAIPDTRRETYVIAPDHSTPESGPRLGAMPKAGVTVIHQQERVEPALQIKHATFPALKVAYDNQAYHMAQFDQFRLLAFFVTAGILVLLVENEHRHERNMDMTKNTILRLPDGAFVKIFASYVRVTSMGTKEDFTATILASAGMCYVSIYLETICVLYVKEGDLPFKSRGNQHDQSG